MNEHDLADQSSFLKWRHDREEKFLSWLNVAFWAGVLVGAVVTTAVFVFAFVYLNPIPK